MGKLKWIDPKDQIPEEGQYVWVLYHPWDSPSNSLGVQAATHRDGVYYLDNNMGTSHPPVGWYPNANQQPPEP